MDKIEAEAIRMTAYIRASEDWANQYGKDPKTHAMLVALNAKWQVQIQKSLKVLAGDSLNYIDWFAYMNHPQLQADNTPFNVNVIIKDDGLDDYDNTFMTLSLELVSEIIATGAKSGETVYGIPLGISSTDANIQALSTKQVAALVGKKVILNPDGSIKQIIDNPNAEYDITDTIRNDIVASIQTSLSLGETTDQAITRMSDVITNPSRARTIANTESVNGYQQGLKQFAHDSNAVGKEWLTAGAIDVCQDNADEGPIAIDDTFDSGDSEPTAHPNCLCGMRYIYQAEWDSLNGIDDSSDDDSSDE